MKRFYRNSMNYIRPEIISSAIVSELAHEFYRKLKKHDAPAGTNMEQWSKQAERYLRLKAQP